VGFVKKPVRLYGDLFEMLEAAEKDRSQEKEAARLMMLPRPSQNSAQPGFVEVGPSPPD